MSILKTIKQDNTYEVRVELSDKLIGHFIPSDDGFYYFAFNDSKGGGLWSDYTLIEIGTKLKEINKPWSDQIKEMFEKES